jgi:hypothetical protein
MLNEIYVIDDVISKGYQDIIEHELLNQNAPWHYQRDIALDVNDPNAQKNIKGKTPGLSHIFFDVDSGGIRSPMYYLTLPMMFEAFAKVNVTPQMIIQARSFMHMPLADKLRKEYDNIHVDYGRDHLVCLYYVNDTDGDTILFDKTFNDVNPQSDFSQVDWKIIKRVSPKKGRAVLFDGRRYHSSSGPSQDVRCIINFDVV